MTLVRFSLSGCTMMTLALCCAGCCFLFDSTMPDSTATTTPPPIRLVVRLDGTLVTRLSNHPLGGYASGTLRLATPWHGIDHLRFHFSQGELEAIPFCFLAWQLIFADPGSLVLIVKPEAEVRVLESGLRSGDLVMILAEPGHLQLYPLPPEWFEAQKQIDIDLGLKNDIVLPTLGGQIKLPSSWPMEIPTTPRAASPPVGPLANPELLDSPVPPTR